MFRLNRRDSQSLVLSELEGRLLDTFRVERRRATADCSLVLTPAMPILGGNPVKRKDSSKVVLDALRAGSWPPTRHFGYLDTNGGATVPEAFPGGRRWDCSDGAGWASGGFGV